MMIKKTVKENIPNKRSISDYIKVRLYMISNDRCHTQVHFLDIFICKLRWL
ncbi:TPA: hypothetical protein KON86_002769 [Clostridioides difficile]|nr:hypothetical protein [Clostridioides difficile]HBG1420673.1 hypothetical protein [Clostridioides difficile]